MLNIENLIKTTENSKIDKQYISNLNEKIYEIYNELADDSCKNLAIELIITEQYSEDVFKISSEICTAFLPTDDGINTGFAVVLKDDRINGKYFIMMNSLVALAAINNKDSVKYLFINVFAHELAHIKCYEYEKNIDWFNESNFSNEVIRANVIWREYYACREASHVFYIDQDFLVESKNNIKMQEERITENYKKLLDREISVTIFEKNENYYLDSIFIQIAYIFGNLSYEILSQDEPENCFIQCCEVFEGKKIQKMVLEIQKEYRKLYDMFPHWESEDIFLQIIKLSKEYISYILTKSSN
ncbi:MAG: hypothetical protein VB122_04960 [Erysipelotrichales bacterium]|nr:hypothetical protein [Erysipelotrichales bacterium]